MTRTNLLIFQTFQRRNLNDFVATVLPISDKHNKSTGSISRTESRESSDLSRNESDNYTNDLDKTLEADDIVQRGYAATCSSGAESENYEEIIRVKVTRTSDN